ncbi:dethiobiotin synthase [Maribacter sp. 4G9]|uniref:dethiobiotin synthase n=1 Tax=Maribacter sp. 4G9 TaxID=1889777 RepID=UPI000C1601F7|nr:dethiobiotin synthase [Maribacter sp. 4G9]PIB31495.1 dethiobiotin synthase [Maribacter sp. 4G9]
MQKIFVTGISTGVGKTVASAIITEALQADYWKPVQSGDLDQTDSDTVKNLISNDKTSILPSSYELTAAMSPHAAAEIDGVKIDRFHINEPATDRNLVIEGAGGLLVPLNDEDTMFDIIMPEYKVVVVSKHYLGSINHTLLTIGWLQNKGYDVSVLFNGKENPQTERIILYKTGVPLIGRIDEEPRLDKTVVARYAGEFRHILESL